MINNYICEYFVTQHVMNLDLISLLSGYDSITLEEMGKVKLMNRTDTKYVVSLPVLAEILQRATESGYVLMPSVVFLFWR